MTDIYVVSGTGQTSPLDYNNASNLIEAWGGGGSGAADRNSTTINALGGGGGEYRASANFSVATPGTTAFAYTIGPGGAAAVKTSSGNGGVVGNAGTQTTFDTTTLVAKPGQGGPLPTASASTGGAGGTGGTGAAGNADGGRGGSSAAAVNQGAVTGGGAAGSAAGVGGNGVDQVAVGATTNGGAGANTGATAGSAATGAGTPITGGNGGNGTDNSTHSGGGGGGGAKGTATTSLTTGGSGGNYGGGGGGAQNTGASTGSITSGAGIAGLIRISYTPAVAGSVTYPQLERGIRGMGRGMMTGSLH